MCRTLLFVICASLLLFLVEGGGAGSGKKRKNEPPDPGATPPTKKSKPSTTQHKLPVTAPDTNSETDSETDSSESESSSSESDLETDHGTLGTMLNEIEWQFKYTDNPGETELLVEIGTEEWQYFEYFLSPVYANAKEMTNERLTSHESRITQGYAPEELHDGELLKFILIHVYSGIVPPGAMPNYWVTDSFHYSEWDSVFSTSQWGGPSCGYIAAKSLSFLFNHPDKIPTPAECNVSESEVTWANRFLSLLEKDDDGETAVHYLHGDQVLKLLVIGGRC
eukprot:TRINITY_DN104970_c0_g1_i1.p1 TRINITY_DN104970_c0_g1~~TRINITY_DN104970_c0_g1_i1.p1  ORF type:complete len:280 (+),score=8.82 TRINITY_DN104970_c0_g1_i1:20-859(+)